MRCRAGLWLAALAGIAVTACEARPKTVFPQTEGVVMMLETGDPVAGVEVVAGVTGASTASDADGRFVFLAEIGRDTSLPLPASGVYMKREVLRAETADAHAYAPVNFLSIDETAMLPVALFLAMKETAYDRSGLPEDCVLTGEETYALQMLSAGRTDGLQAWLEGAEETGERAFYLEEWMDYVLVRALPRRCEIVTPQLMSWMEDIRALFGTEN